MKVDELTLAVVGIRHRNADGSSRVAELLLCARGEPVYLVPEPHNPHDACAVAVVSARRIQIGYLSAARAAWISRRLRAGELAEALFQDQHETVAAIRVRFGGGAPTLPRRRPLPAPVLRELPIRQAPVRDWYPDPPAPDWGA
ncbi:MAG: HIRAN domain-containing protein [Sphingomonas sp.]|nr:HIRAN domain-containing protein [Sphingomonas sp.]